LFSISTPPNLSQATKDLNMRHQIKFGLTCLVSTLLLCCTCGVCDSHKVIPKPKSLGSFSTNILPTLKVIYCPVSGFDRAYEQYALLISEKYKGDILSKGEPYQHPNLFLHHLVSYGCKAIRFLLIAVFLFKTDLITRRFRIISPDVESFLSQHKMIVSMTTFLLLSSLEAKLCATGHFEIFYNEIPVWSRVESGRFPTPGELFQIIDNQILIRNHHPKLSL